MMSMNAPPATIIATRTPGAPIPKAHLLVAAIPAMMVMVAAAAISMNVQLVFTTVTLWPNATIMTVDSTVNVK